MATESGFRVRMDTCGAVAESQSGSQVYMELQWLWGLGCGRCHYSGDSTDLQRHSGAAVEPESAEHVCPS